MSMTQEYLKAIARKLAYLPNLVARNGDVNCYDENSALEDVVCKLLNLAYGYNLQNANNIRMNHPGIDLCDPGTGIAVQVTSDNTGGKIERTLRTFDQHGLGSEYRRVIIFLLSERKEYRKQFSSDFVSFLPERDIMDFSTLMRQIRKCDDTRVKEIHDYLEEQYPGIGPNTKWIKYSCIAIGVLLLVTILWNIGLFLYREYRDAHPKYAYETKTDWLTMDEAAAVLTAQSKVQVFTEYAWFEEFSSGAVLTVLYNNLDEQDRVITEFTVFAEDIVEDLSPRMLFNAYTLDSDGSFLYSLYNIGWGETGEITIRVASLTPRDTDGEVLPDRVSLKEDAPRSWTMESIKPGEWPDFRLLQPEDFYVVRMEDLEEPIHYLLVYELYAPESDFTMTLECNLSVSSDGIRIAAGGGGAGGDTSYVVWVPTSEPTWSQTYRVHQILPGKKAVRLPIFIVPEKSCTMTVRIQFRTMDGEVIEATPLENVHYFISYYESQSNFVDGMMLDWSQVDGETVVFPFAATPYVLPEGESHETDR